MSILKKIVNREEINKTAICVKDCKEVDLEKGDEFIVTFIGNFAHFGDNKIFDESIFELTDDEIEED